MFLKVTEGNVFTGRNEGNIFTSVCQEFCPQGGEGVCLSACWDTPPEQTPPGADTPQEQTPYPPEQTPPSRSRPPSPGPDTPPEQTPSQEQTPPRPDTPLTRHPPSPGRQTPAYGLRAAGTHPTGMHSCYSCLSGHKGVRYHFLGRLSGPRGGGGYFEKASPKPQNPTGMLSSCE